MTISLPAFRTWKPDLHRLCAFAVFVIALIVYRITMAPSVSFWDVGEFVTVSTILGVSHPPGAPLFILWMHLLSLLPLSTDIAVRCSYLATVTGAFVVTFAYLIIVRLLHHLHGPDESIPHRIALCAGGVIGALSLAWSYSMWFNSVEAILFTPSLFCTTLCVWLALVWYEKADEPDSARYLLLIALIVGLAIGVHLLSVLSIPAMVLIIYFRLRRPTAGSFIGWLILAMLITLVVYPGVVKYLPALASRISLVMPLVVLAALAYGFNWARRKGHGLTGVVMAAALLILVGCSTYAYVFIRAERNPAVNENNPSNPARFFSYMNREQYGSRPIFPRIWNNDPAYHSAGDFFWRYQVNKMYFRYLWWQFIGREGAPEREYQDAGVSPQYSVLGLLADQPSGVLRLLALLTCAPFMLGLLGFVHQYMKDKPGWVIVFTLFFMTGLAIVLYLNQEDPQPRERDYSYVGSFFAFALWIGIGSMAAIEWFVRKTQAANRPVLSAALFSVLLLMLSPVMLLGKNYHMDSRRGNYVAEDYTYNMLNSCAPNAILITNGDNDTFPVWYMQEVKQVRRDVRIVNLSLVNTGWYIKQLRDNQPRVPISFSDNYIDRYFDAEDVQALLSRYWPPDKQKVELTTPQGKMQWVMPATMYVPIRDQPSEERTSNFLRVQDIMMLDILRSNFDPAKTPVPKPFYFAVTVPSSSMIGLKDFLSMDGLVFRLDPKGDSPLDPDMLKRNVLEVYDRHMRGINDPRVHYDDNVDRLLSNYRSAFLQLAYYYMTQPDSMVVPAVDRGSNLEGRLTGFDRLGNSQKALTLLEEMERRIPEDVRPSYSPELEVQIGKMYEELGRTGELRLRLDRLVRQKDLPPETQALVAATYYTVLNDTARGTAMLDSIVSRNPTRDVLYAVGVQLASARAYEPATRYLERALEYNADDGEVVGALLQVYAASGALPKARTFLESWMSRHPSDKGAKSRLDALLADSASHPVPAK